MVPFHLDLEFRIDNRSSSEQDLGETLIGTGHPSWKRIHQLTEALEQQRPRKQREERTGNIDQRNPDREKEVVEEKMLGGLNIEAPDGKLRKSDGVVRCSTWIHQFDVKRRTQ
jgi:hypothetical protein